MELSGKSSATSPMFGAAPPQQTTFSKTLALARSLSFGAIGLAIVVLFFEMIAPDGRRPSQIIGAFHGSTTEAQLNTEREAQEKTAAAVAAAQAKAQAQWAMEVEAARQQLAAITASLEAKQTAANLADYICYSGPIAVFLLGRDANQYAQAAGGACGEASRLRREIVEAQAEAARIGSAIMQRPVPVASAR